MHIAVFTDYYLPTLGGVQTSIKAQKDTLEKAGHKVTIFCPLHQTSTDPSIVRLPTSTRFKPDNYPFAWSPDAVIDASISHIRELGDVDIIHIHSEMAAAIGGIHAGQSLRIPIVQTMHGRVDVYTKNLQSAHSFWPHSIDVLFPSLIFPLHQRITHAPASLGACGVC